MSSWVVSQKMPRPGLFFTQYEARSRLQQLSGSSAISSSDLFGDVDGAHGAGRAQWCGRHQARPASRAGGCCDWEGLAAWLRATPSFAFTGSVSLGNVLPTADIAQFKQGVKSVAGKMAVLANGVMNSLQVSVGLLDLRWEGPNEQSLELGLLQSFYILLLGSPLA